MEIFCLGHIPYREQLEMCKEYLGAGWALHPDFKASENPAVTFRDGAYCLKPENIEITRLMALDTPFPPKIVETWKD